MNENQTTEPACAARDRLEVELHAAHEVIKQLRAEIADLKGRIAEETLRDVHGALDAILRGQHLGWDRALSAARSIMSPRAISRGQGSR